MNGFRHGRIIAGKKEKPGFASAFPIVRKIQEMKVITQCVRKTNLEKLFSTKR
jgi:hypothetical protein